MRSTREWIYTELFYLSLIRRWLSKNLRDMDYIAGFCFPSQIMTVGIVVFIFKWVKWRQGDKIVYLISLETPWSCLPNVQETATPSTCISLSIVFAGSPWSFALVFIFTYLTMRFVFWRVQYVQNCELFSYKYFVVFSNNWEIWIEGNRANV